MTKILYTDKDKKVLAIGNEQTLIFTAKREELMIYSISDERAEEIKEKIIENDGEAIFLEDLD